MVNDPNESIKSVSDESPDSINTETVVTQKCIDDSGDVQSNDSGTSSRCDSPSSNVMPLDYLLSLITDNAVDIRLRISAAKAAAPYLHVRQSLNGSLGEQHEISHDDAIDTLE